MASLPATRRLRRRGLLLALARHGLAARGVGSAIAPSRLARSGDARLTLPAHRPLLAPAVAEEVVAVAHLASGAGHAAAGVVHAALGAGIAQTALVLLADVA